MNKDKEEYGEQRFEDMIRFSSALESEQVADLVVDDIRLFAEGTKFRDDVSILVLEVELRYQKFLDKLKEAENAEKNNDMVKWRKALEESIRINPDNIKSRKKLAMYYLKQKEYEKALDQLKAYVERNQENPYVYTMLGFCHYKLDRISKAISITNVALHSFPKYQEAIQNLAFYHIKLEKYDVAKTYIDMLKEINPKNNMIENLSKLLPSN